MGDPNYRVKVAGQVFAYQADSAGTIRTNRSLLREPTVPETEEYYPGNWIVEYPQSGLVRVWSHSDFQEMYELIEGCDPMYIGDRRCLT